MKEVRNQAGLRTHVSQAIENKRGPGGSLEGFHNIYWNEEFEAEFRAQQDAIRRPICEVIHPHTYIEGSSPAEGEEWQEGSSNRPVENCGSDPQFHQPLIDHVGLKGNCFCKLRSAKEWGEATAGKHSTLTDSEKRKLKSLNDRNDNPAGSSLLRFNCNHVDRSGERLNTFVVGDVCYGEETMNGDGQENMIGRCQLATTRP
jgi:hypothetical protein